jgi:hypothetical protein
MDTMEQVHKVRTAEEADEYVKELYGAGLEAYTLECDDHFEVRWNEY